MNKSCNHLKTLPSYINRSICVIFAGLLFNPTAILSADKSTIDYPKFENQFFMGETYPSGRLYIKAFQLAENGAANLKMNGQENKIPIEQLPEKIHGICAADIECKNPAVNYRNFSYLRSGYINPVLKFIKDPPGSIGVGTETMDYLPAREKMKEIHCALPDPYTEKNLNPDYQYAAGSKFPDFFQRVDENLSEECDFYDGNYVIQYTSEKTPPKNLAYMVFGMAPSIQLTQIHYFPVGKQAVNRPLTAEEKARSEELKQNALEHEANCPPVASYIEQAQILLEANIANSPYQIRLSRYSAIGCLSDTDEESTGTQYILDILKNNRIEKTYSTAHYSLNIFNGYAPEDSED